MGEGITAQLLGEGITAQLLGEGITALLLGEGITAQLLGEGITAQLFRKVIGAAEHAEELLREIITAGKLPHSGTEVECDPHIDITTVWNL